MTALYIRLSREDSAGRESNSVATQRSILVAYAKGAGLLEYREYVDDGYSGTNLDRPAFLHLKQDIECGEIDTVIVKDLSRLARNSGDANALLDEYFPLYGVRFVSVGEGVDTANGGAGAAFAPLANMMHEYYARDISGKIRSALYARMDAGRFVGARAPFGYTARDGVLIPSGDAPTVRRVFELAAAGQSIAQISRLTGVTAARLRGILHNTVYLGMLAQGKTRKLSFKSAKVITIPPDRRHIVRHTHAPLISQQLYHAAQRALAKRSSSHSSFENIFSGIAYCADCGSRMSTVGTRRAGSPCALACGAYKQHGCAACTNHHIDYLTLCDAVRRALCELALDPERLSELSGCTVRECADFLRFDTLTAPLLFALIERIEISQGTAGRDRDQQIRIKYTFSSCETVQIHV